MEQKPDYEELKIDSDRVDTAFDSFDIDDLLEQRIEKIISKCAQAEIQDSTIKRVREVYINGI